MGKRLVTIDGSQDRNGELQRARRNHPNAILTSDVLTLVNGVLRAMAGEKISQLDIIGHGVPGQVIVGGGTTHCDSTKVIGINENFYLFNYNILTFLKGCFEEDAVVRIHACRVAEGAKGNAFLWQLANLWNVRVQGALVKQFADRADRFEGRYYVEASGNGNLGNILTNHRI